MTDAIARPARSLRKRLCYALWVGMCLTIGLSAGGSSALAATDKALETLYERLGKARDDSEARRLEAAISRNWLRSGSATADLLFERSEKALVSTDAPLAVELLDRAIVMSPDWTEAYARRGQLLAVLGHEDRAVADFHQVLLRDPRHFITLQMLGSIFAQNNLKPQALAFYERALEVNPHLEGARKALDKLRLAVDGQPT